MSELTELFQNAISQFFVSYDNLAQAAHEDPMNGELLGEVLDDEFEVFSELVCDQRTELARAIVNADYHPKDGDGPFDNDSFWFRREHDWTESDPIEEVRSAIEELKGAVKARGHSLELRPGGTGRNARVDMALRDLSTELKGHALRMKKGMRLFRARVGRHQELSELAAPPPAKASPGRGNLAGQPVLYLADSVETAVAEVRPSLGDDVTVAECEVLRSGRVCSFVHSPVRFSVFKDPVRFRALADHQARRRSIGYDFARPVRPTDVAQDYLFTQFIARLVRELRMDGLVFPSSQNGTWPSAGINYLLFDPAHARPTSLQVLTVTGIKYTTHLAPGAAV